MPLYGAFQPWVLALCAVPYGLRHNTLMKAGWLKAADVCFCQRDLKKWSRSLRCCCFNSKLCTLVMETVGRIPIRIILIQEIYSHTHLYRCHTSDVTGCLAPMSLEKASCSVWRTSTLNDDQWSECEQVKKCWLECSLSVKVEEHSENSLRTLFLNFVQTVHL